MRPIPWNDVETAELFRLFDEERLTYAECVERMIARFGRRFSVPQVKSHVARLRNRALSSEIPIHVDLGQIAERVATVPAPVAPPPHVVTLPPRAVAAEPVRAAPEPVSDVSRGGRAEAKESEDALIRRLTEMAKKSPVSLEAACDAVDVSPKRLRDLIEIARGKGSRIELDGDHVGLRPYEARSDPSIIPVQGAGESRIIAAVGDIHYGSKHHLHDQFQDFCRIAYARGVRTFLQVGDLLDGNYRHSVWEQSARGFEEQSQLAIKQLPQMPGATWHWILGNHDETLGEHSGAEVGYAVTQAFHAAGRHDLVYHGARGAYVRLADEKDKRGLFVEIWHPRDRASAYAKSYRLQKKVEKYAPGTKPDLLLAGHWHQSAYLPLRGMHAISSGCWQGGQSSFGKSLGGAPDIGSWIIEYALTPSGTVRHFRPEWVAYYEQEQVREVALS